MQGNLDRDICSFSEPDAGFKILMELLSSVSDSDVIRIQKAYDFSSKAHAGQKRLSGESYIVHPLNVAIILSQLGMDADSIIAALLHDVVEDTPITNEIIESEFGSTICSLVDGLTKINTISLAKGNYSADNNNDKNKTREMQQQENIRKMLLAMSKDVRVIIIKLADRLHNMRTLSFKEEHRRREIAQETLEIYAPIAHRLGIRPVKEELEDLAIGYLDPVAYKEIADRLDNQLTERTKFLDNVKEALSLKIISMDPNVQISARIKSIHGIYRKMYMQNKEFEQIYDIYAVRILVSTVFDCYNCLGIIHDLFKPIPGRFKDYISNPKSNMYQSLHTTVLGDKGIPFEVQIRTFEMHHTAEYGVAAHWKYKLGMQDDRSVNEHLNWVRQILDAQQNGDYADDIVTNIKSDLLPEEVFAFTPKGDVISLPYGATVIDFAYAVHSAVGNRMIGAKVGGKIVPIDYNVNTGDIIEILTSSQVNHGPSRDWLTIVKTSQARTKIRQWFKKECRQENIDHGKIEIDREFRKNFIHLDDDELDEFILKIAERQHCNSLDDFYAAIGYGGITLSKIMPRIKDDYNNLKKTQNKEIPNTVVQHVSKSNEGVIVEGIDNCLIKFSKCCNPLPGDPIIGFITRGHGVSIHNRNCTNVPKDIESSQEPDRWISAYWDQKVKEIFNATLRVFSVDRIGMLADVTCLLAASHLLITDISAKSIKDGNSIITVSINVNGIEHLKTIIDKLSKIDGVINVERTGL